MVVNIDEYVLLATPIVNLLSKFYFYWSYTNLVIFNYGDNFFFRYFIKIEHDFV